MLRRNGTFILQGRAGDEPDEKKEAELALRIEQYLNDRIAMQLFKEFGVLLRVHLK